MSSESNKPKQKFYKHIVFLKKRRKGGKLLKTYTHTHETMKKDIGGHHDPFLQRIKCWVAIQDLYPPHVNSFLSSVLIMYLGLKELIPASLACMRLQLFSNSVFLRAPTEHSQQRNLPRQICPTVYQVHYFSQ